MIKVLLDTSPLENANSIRGVGSYTRHLAQSLKDNRKIDLKLSYELNATDFSPEIIHYPFFDLFFATLPIKRHVKTIVTVHDLIPLVFPDHYKPGKRGIIRYLRQKIALKKVDAIIADSESSKKDIVKFLGINEQKVHVVYLAANPGLKSADKSAQLRITRKLALPKNYIMYVGDINYNKNLPQLIKCLKFLPPTIKLVCVGSNFKPQKIDEWKAIETQIALSDVSSRVKFYTDIDKNDLESLSAIYSGAICYVQPSLYEGFGLPVLEAMQCKTPVVSTRNSSLIEVGGENVLFTDENAESIALAVEEVTSWSTQKRAKWLAKAYQWSQNFSWRKVARDTINVYEKVCRK